jgi:hypothetical protein
MTPLRRLLAVLPPLLALACGDLLSPGRGDRYVLTTVGGEALPAPEAPNSPLTIVADTIAFVEITRSGGRLRHRTVVAHSGISETWSFERAFRWEGDVLSFTRMCPINGLCAFNSYQARIEGSQLRITYPSIYPDHVYDRLP